MCQLTSRSYHGAGCLTVSPGNIWYVRENRPLHAVDVLEQLLGVFRQVAPDVLLTRSAAWGIEGAGGIRRVGMAERALLSECLRVYANSTPLKGGPHPVLIIADLRQSLLFKLLGSEGLLLWLAAVRSSSAVGRIACLCG
jgi:hypothetical protein